MSKITDWVDRAVAVVAIALVFGAIALAIAWYG